MRASFVVGIAVVGALYARAAAQPGNTPPPPPPQPPPYQPYPTPPPAPPPVAGPIAGEKSPGMALALSLGGTVGSFALASVGGGVENDALATIGGLGMWVAPSFGHWYAGKLWTHGLTMRMAGAGAIVVGAVLLIDDCVNDEVGCDGETPGFALIIGGAGLFVIGGVYDIVTAPTSAHRYNERLRARTAGGWAVAPVITQERAGLVLGTRF
jgi:hypothetical protein